MSPLEAAFNALTNAAEHWAANLGESDAASRLAKAADEYARAKWASKTGANGTKRGERPSTSASTTLPFGRSKGVTLADAKDGDLRWCLGAVEKSIDDESKARWRDANVALRDAIDAELAWRGGA